MFGRGYFGQGYFGSGYFGSGERLPVSSAVGQAMETDIAQTVIGDRLVDIDEAIESSISQSFAYFKKSGMGVAIEHDGSARVDWIGGRGPGRHFILGYGQGADIGVGRFARKRNR